MKDTYCNGQLRNTNLLLNSPTSLKLHSNDIWQGKGFHAQLQINQISTTSAKSPPTTKLSTHEKQRETISVKKKTKEI